MIEEEENNSNPFPLYKYKDEAQDGANWRGISEWLVKVKGNCEDLGEPIWLYAEKIDLRRQSILERRQPMEKYQNKKNDLHMVSLICKRHMISYRGKYFGEPE